MKCGHIAQGVAGDGSPVCVICSGIKKEASQIEKECSGTDGLEGRIAKCYCGKTQQSKWELPFFEFMKNSKQDNFYCGHDGWD